VSVLSGATTKSLAESTGIRGPAHFCSFTGPIDIPSLDELYGGP
jgi:hypothetical protein